MHNPFNEGFDVFYTDYFIQKLQLTPFLYSTAKQRYSAQYSNLISKSTMVEQISNMLIVIFETTDHVVMLA
jgi:hypothetical protein